MIYYDNQDFDTSALYLEFKQFQAHVENPPPPPPQQAPPQQAPPQQEQHQQQEHHDVPDIQATLKVGFGKHGVCTYIEALEKYPEYCQWCVEQAQRAECGAKLAKFAKWCVEHAYV